MIAKWKLIFILERSASSVQPELLFPNKILTLNLNLQPLLDTTNKGQGKEQQSTKETKGKGKQGTLKD